MSSQPQKDDALFEALGKSKKKRKHKIIRTIIIVIVVLAIVAIMGVSYLQRQVREQFASSSAEVQSYEVSTGTISTVVSGSGVLSNVDTETVDVPSGVEISKILVEVNDPVSEGDVLAIVDMASVRSTLSDLQAEMEALDEQISEAEEDEVSSNIEAGISGRVKIVYAQADADVADTMVEHGALAVLSLDGYMAVDIETEALSAGDSVTVIREDGGEITGSVESALNGVATVLVTDNGPQFDEEVTVMGEDGSELGKGKLYIHSPFSVTGFAGTVSKVYATENKKVNDYTDLFYLKDTGYSANYDTLLRSRSELEETLLELFALQRDGCVFAPISGSVYTVADLDSEEEITDVVTISPDVSMSVTISVDESDILSLALGQEADVTVSSISEDTLTGTVTEIDKSSSDTSGTYSAVVTLDKIDGMLSGMTASVDVKIEGVENAIVIPVEALHQTRDRAYVYTSYDEETEEYGGRVDVVTGLSNSNYVEIKSGLSVGDTVYYTEPTNVFDMFGSHFGGNFGGRGDMGNFGGESGGEMPNMGDMPGGNFGGGNFGGGNYGDGERPNRNQMPEGGAMPSGNWGNG